MTERRLGTANPYVATSNSTDDGSDGNFYCINEGSAGGKTGDCTSNTIFVGPHFADTNISSLADADAALLDEKAAVEAEVPCLVRPHCCSQGRKDEV